METMATTTTLADMRAAFRAEIARVTLLEAQRLADPAAMARRQRAVDSLIVLGCQSADIARLRRKVRLWRRVAGAAVVVAMVMAWL